MGPLTLASAPPSSVGSGSESEWGREYEDEDTWYEFSSAYQTGPETHLFPSKDTGLSVRMAKYRRSASHSTTAAPPTRHPRTSMRERRDLRDLDKEIEMEEKEGGGGTRAGLRTVSHLKGIMASNTMAEGEEEFLKTAYRFFLQILVAYKKNSFAI